MGTIIDRTSGHSYAGVDPLLLGWIQAAAANSPYNVAIQSGKREGDPRFHGKGMAIDVQLIDPATGKVVPNYQTAESFQAYQSFANAVRGAQMASNPEAANRLRWGGYFSGGKGKYGALDLMHFDVGGDTTPMGGGGWATGLTPEQAALWKLSPGGGYSGAGTVATAFQGPPVAPQEDASAFRDIDLSGIAKNASKRLAPQQPDMAGTGATAAMPLQPVETVAATPDELAAPWKAAEPGLRQMSPLADLFQVKDIGAPVVPGATAPFALPKRGWT